MQLSARFIAYMELGRLPESHVLMMTLIRPGGLVPSLRVDLWLHIGQ